MFYGREYGAEQLRAHCGSASQIARIASCELCDGREKGVRCLDFHTGSGFNFMVVPDRAMDIAFAEYKGINLAWMSGTGITSPSYYDPAGAGWMRGFFGGLMTTCGLLNVGVPDEYMGEQLGLHGRISNTPATNVSFDSYWVGDDYYLLARGEMRELRRPHYNILLKRRIQAMAGERTLHIHDTVVNEGSSRVPHQILYHINVGFPVLSRTSHLLAASQKVTPRDEEAREVQENYKTCSDPTPGYKEKVYYHHLAPCTDNRGWAAVVNPDLEDGLGVYVKFDLERLPVLTQWKMMGHGTYVMGIEPCNSYGIGMGRQNSLGTLKSLDPGQEMDYHLEIGVLAGEADIRMFEREVSLAAPDCTGIRLDSGLAWKLSQDGGSAWLRYCDAETKRHRFRCRKAVEWMQWLRIFFSAAAMEATAQQIPR